MLRCSIAVATLFGIALAIAPSLPAMAQSAEDDGEYPDLLDGTLSGQGDLEDDEKPHSSFLRLPTALEGWFAWKAQIAQDYGLSFGGSYGVLGQHYTDSLIGEEDSVGGKFAFNLSYEAFNRGDPDAFIIDMVIEDRGPIGTEEPPLWAGLGTGSIVPTAATWGEFNLGVTQFYVRQNLFDNRFQYTVGKIFAPNFINAYPFFDDNRQFLNQTFSTSPTIPSPLRGFGAVGALYPVENSGLYLKGGIYNANSDDTGITIDNFFEKKEFFYQGEIGWSSLARSGVPIQARGPMDTNNFSLTPWYKDEQENGIPKAKGIAFNANYLIREDTMIFMRGGWSDGWVIDKNFTAGFGWRPFEAYSDLFGFGGGWANPTNDALDTQYTLEAFYRFHLTPNLAFTPDVQLMFNPALNPNVDTLWAFGLRTRVTF